MLCVQKELLPGTINTTVCTLDLTIYNSIRLTMAIHIVFFVDIDFG